MCNCYEYDLAEWELRELVEHYTLIGRNWRAPIQVFPHQQGEVVVRRGDECTLEPMLWALTPKPWKPLIQNRTQRCVVPVTRFAVSARSSGPAEGRWFARPNHKPFMFAGVWTTWHGNRSTTEASLVGKHRFYSIMTTEANDLVQPIDDAMPVILTTSAEVERWLTGSLDEALALLRPAASDVLKLLPEELKAA